MRFFHSVVSFIPPVLEVAGASIYRGAVTHFIQAFAGRLPSIQAAAVKHGARYVEIFDGLMLVPATEMLLSQLSTGTATVAPFSELTIGALERWREAVNGDTFGYFETEYFGGDGVQRAGAWRGPEILVEPVMRQGVVNDMFRALGVVRSFGRDEWDTIGLVRFRSMKQLIAATG